MLNKRVFIAIVAIASLAYAYRTITFDCGPGCTTNPEKIAAGCPECPLQEPAVEVVEVASAQECNTCGQKTDDFFHDNVYVPATEDI